MRKTRQVMKWGGGGGREAGQFAPLFLVNFQQPIIQTSGRVGGRGHNIDRDNGLTLSGWLAAAAD